MSGSSFQWNEDGLNEFYSHVQQQVDSSELKKEMDGRVQAIVRQVNDEMAGQPTNEIIKVLRVRITQAGFEPNFKAVAEVAQAISEQNFQCPGT